MEATIGHNNPPSDQELLVEKLQEANAKALKRAEALIAAAERVPAKIETKEDAEKITDLEKQIAVCAKALEDGRVRDKAPYLAATTAIDGFFRPYKTGLDTAKARVKTIQTAFLVAEEKKERDRRAELASQEREAADAKLAEAAKLDNAGDKVQAQAVLQKAVSHDHDAAFFADAAQDTGAKVAQTVGETTGARSSLRYVKTGEIIDRETLDLNRLRPYLSNDVLQKALNMFVRAGGTELKGAKIWDKPEATTR